MAPGVNAWVLLAGMLMVQGRGDQQELHIVIPALRCNFYSQAGSVSKLMFQGLGQPLLSESWVDWEERQKQVFDECLQWPVLSLGVSHKKASARNVLHGTFNTYVLHRQSKEEDVYGSFHPRHILGHHPAPFHCCRSLPPASQDAPGGYLTAQNLTPILFLEAEEDLFFFSYHPYPSQQNPHRQPRTPSIYSGIHEATVGM